VTCTCGLKVSEVNKWVRMSLIGGLNDEDTKLEVLSKVDEMPLDETITFVEAREIGKTALKILGGKLTSGQVNKVHQDREDQRSCTYCGQEAHGKSLLLLLMTSPNMLTPAPMLLWQARLVTRQARWVGQDLTCQRWLGRSLRRKM
jgi:hypothetical protein